MLRRAGARVGDDKAGEGAGLDPTGPDGPLRQFTRTVPETALDEEMTEHPGRAKHEKSARGRSANTRNGTTVKTVTADGVGPVTIEVPRDRDGPSEPVIVKKRQRRLNDVDEVVLSLYAKGLTTGEISAHFAQIGAPTKLAKRELGDLSRTRPCVLTVQLRSRMKSKITSKTCWLQKSYSCSASSTSTSCASTPCSTSRSRILTD